MSDGALILGISLVPTDPLSWMLCQSGGNRRLSTGTKGQFRVRHPLPRVRRVMTKSYCHPVTKALGVLLRFKMQGRLLCPG